VYLVPISFRIWVKFVNIDDLMSVNFARKRSQNGIQYLYLSDVPSQHSEYWRCVCHYAEKFCLEESTAFIVLHIKPSWFSDRVHYKWLAINLNTYVSGKAARKKTIFFCVKYSHTAFSLYMPNLLG
jgi:hypothetical protein